MPSGTLTLPSVPRIPSRPTRPVAAFAGICAFIIYRRTDQLAKTQQNTYAKTNYANGARPGLSEYAEHYGAPDNVKLPVLNLSVRLPSLTTTGDYGRQIPVEGESLVIDAR